MFLLKPNLNLAAQIATKMSANHKQQTIATFQHQALGLLLLIVAMFALPGCGNEVETRLEDYLMELEFETPLDSAREIKLGSYFISVAARQQETSRNEYDRKWMRLNFELMAVVDPRYESRVRSEIARHRGLLDDTVMLVCRNASLDELTDNRWAILKSRIIDRLRPILGEDYLRQVIVVNNLHEPI